MQPLFDKDVFLQTLAHSLKGMCGVVRVDGLVGLALSMERASKNGDLGKAKELYARFSDMLTTTHSEMQAFLDG